MSLTNPSSVVTEERLSEFYQGILPYLGGMPDILANKFDKANMFSTDEKIVGRWIDGKPLYQKTYVDTLSSSSASQGIPIDSTYSVTNIYAIIFNDTVRILNGHFDGTNRFNVYINENNNITIIRNNSTSWSGKSVVITIQYTKTTDSPVEIGIDTDYSTTEKIVGTWIDGRPIYQKTIVGEITSTSASRAWFDLYDATDLNIDDIFFQSESNYVTSGYSIPVFGTLFSQADNYINVAYATTSHKIQFIKYGFGAGKYKITFNYTKTTD